MHPPDYKQEKLINRLFVESLRVPRQRYIEVALVALIYIVSARIGQLVAIPPGNVTPVWLPSGIMVAIAFIRGPQIWPGVFIGAFAGNAWAYFSVETFSIAARALFAGTLNGIGDVISTVVAVQVLIYLTGEKSPLKNFRHFSLFLLFAVFIGPGFSALFGVTSLAMMGFLDWSAYGFTLTTWWTGDGVGALLLGPFLLAWYARIKQSDRSGPVWQTLLISGLSALLAWILFGMVDTTHWVYLMCLVLAPILMVTSLYYGQENCSSGVLCFSAIGVFATSISTGPFATSSQELNLLELQLLIAVISVVMYFLSITVRQRLDVEQQILQREKTLAEAQKIASLGSWELDPRDNSLTWSKEVFRIFEVDPSNFPGNYEGFLALVHPGDRDYVNRTYAESLKNKTPYDIEHRLLMSDGRVKYVNERCETRFDKTGNPTRSLGTVLDITERKLTEEKILHQAHYDALTNLPNRFLSLDRLSQLLREADRDNNKVAILFLDLDDFKKVNDSLGHETGDSLLIEVAGRLQSVFRVGDTVGRLGGDEFLVLLRALHNTYEASVAAENLLSAFREPFIIKEREFIITASIGIVMYPGGGKNATEVLRNADSAMYHSKGMGRNSYSFFTTEMNQKASRRLAVEEQMRGALERNEFSVHYQGQIDVSTGKIVGAEALLRWKNDVLGQVGPDEFIPIAEHTGLIIPLGNFVLSQALRTLVDVKQSGDHELVMAVNLSPRQFRDTSLVSSIENGLKEFNLQASSLELEITEGVLISGYANVNQALQSISKLGVRVSLDDFGTGYASLNYLRNYPFDFIKIDRSFINDIQEPKGRELVNAAIAMAHALGLKVVAEGVEEANQLKILKELGCDFAQGYYFTKPVCESEFLQLILNTP